MAEKATRLCGVLLCTATLIGICLAAVCADSASADLLLCGGRAGEMIGVYTDVWAPVLRLRLDENGCGVVHGLQPGAYRVTRGDGRCLRVRLTWRGKVETASGTRSRGRLMLQEA